MRDRIVAVSFIASAKPLDRFGVSLKLELRQPDKKEPLVSEGVRWRETKGRVYMIFCFCTASQEELRVADNTVCECEVAI